MLSSESYVSILGLNPKDPKSPDRTTVAFVGIRLSTAVATDLYKKYGVIQILLSSSDLVTTNTDLCSTFVFTNFSFQQPETLTDLWRVAKEGSSVFILNGMKNGIIEKDVAIKDHRDYGLEYFGPGIQSCWQYSRGFIRKDVAKHFRR